jgi:hypothetical protein
MPRSERRWSLLRRQFAACIALPAVAAALPWPLAWRVIRTLAARGRAFGDEAARALAACEAHGRVIDRTSWLARHRAMRIVDHVDPAISAMRGDRWMDRHLRVDGDPVPAQPSVFVGFHYGTGFWSLRHLRRLGHRVSFVSAPVEAAQMAGDPLRLAFLRWRQRRVEGAGGAPVIYVGGSSDRIRTALRSGVSVLALIDVPEPTTSTVAVPLLGHDAQFPDGILRIAASERVPLVGYVASFDMQAGTRRLRFTRLADDPLQALRTLAAMRDAAIRDDPASWHFWAEWPRLAALPRAAQDESGTAALR